MPAPFLIAKGQDEICFDPKMANRHGLIAGATGTGKTVTLQALAEHFSTIGVPVFLADVKGDLSGIAKSGGENPKVADRVKQLGLTGFTATGFPVTFWDIFGENGHPIRATVSEMGPLLLARVLNLNDTQEAVLNMVFHIADQNSLLLLDIKDLRAMLQFVGDNAATFTTQYGNVSAASVGAIQRNLLALEQQGDDQFFGEPALNLDDFLQTAADGRGQINILSAEKLMMSPRTYASALLWLLSELFERLPEVGDLDKPKLVFFFDEAHLLFDDIPDALREKVEQVVRLVRSKAVGVYFITQNPTDIPDKILGQLGNRVQHALRAFSPRDQKAVQSAAETFRQNPALDVAATITQLAVGEALVSLLDDTGTPAIVQRAWIVPPRAQIGPITADERKAIIQSSLIFGTYEKAVDRESAFEILKARAEQRQVTASPPAPAMTAPSVAPAVPAPAATAPATSSGPGFFTSIGAGLAGVLSGIAASGVGPRRSDTLLQSIAKSAARSATTQVTREITRGLLGSLFGGSRR